MNRVGNNENRPQAIFLMGPTASGKTDFAIRLCEELPCDVISVDSALIYKGMDIGTAKPTKDELEKTPHRLIDILDPAESYSVADFRRDALAEMKKVTDSGRIPLLVGGTMMYFKILLEGTSPLPEANQTIRKQIVDEAEQKGWEQLHQELSAVDSEAAQRIHKNDPQRLIRALEVYRITGQPLTKLQSVKGETLDYNVMQLAMDTPDRNVLHDRIEQRFKAMIAKGFEEEVAKLKQRGDLHLNLPSMRCVGYRQMWEYLEGKLDHEEMIFRGIVATRQLAKRQLTWLRSWPDLTLLDSLKTNTLSDIIDRIRCG
ncbi:tRNA (adenosine(37)-N6)-dimethylallyltransferase MiaA [Alteromonadaceae bacterium M269]|nr:tRNA (adenosine(37)-N6)-dimethylallyltransferase MiaA [Alteromonadaceae bacterium M269]